MPAASPLLVVPTDFSAAAGEALSYAVDVARALGADLHLLHVRAETATDEAVAGALAAQAAALEGTVTPVIRAHAAPGAGIEAYLHEVGAALVVLSPSGQRPRRPALGSVAAEVAQTAPCDVLLVPAPPGTGPCRALVAVDFSAASAALIGQAARFAQALGADGVDLVHVLEPLPHPARWLDEAAAGLGAALRQRAEEELGALADAVISDTPDVGLYVEAGRAARTLTRVADALDSGLLVVGAQADRTATDPLLGSVAEGVARRAACPVLLARHATV